MKKYCFVLLIVIGACTSSKNNIDADTELKKAQTKVPGITLKQLYAGKKIYIRDCSGCHALHDASEFTALQWHPILDKMFVKAKIEDSTDRRLITDYIIAKSK